MELTILENEILRVELLPYGAAIYRLIYKPTNTNVVLTSRDTEVYNKPENNYYGSTVGPVAGRIKNGSFKIGDKEFKVEKNERGINSLHSGSNSFAFKTFKLEYVNEFTALYTYTTSENEGGFPGISTLRITYVLESENLKIYYSFESSEDTLVNITNHTHFNLDGEKDIKNHILIMNAKSYMQVDENMINVSEVLIPEDHYFNFREGKLIGPLLNIPDVSKPPTTGIDNLFIVPNKTLFLRGEKIELRVVTNYDGYQIYTCNFNHDLPLFHGRKYVKHAGIALEPVDKIIGINNEYKNIELKKGDVYSRFISYKFTKIS